MAVETLGCATVICADKTGTLTIGPQAMVTFVPMLQEDFRTQALTLEEFLVVTALSAVVFSGVEIEKLCFKRAV